MPPTTPVRSGSPAPWSLVLAAGIVVALGVVVIAGPRGGHRHGGPRPRWAATITPARARVVLARLGVTEPSAEVAYDRVADFGAAWTDVDTNGCDTRNDILHRDLSGVVTRAGTGGCVVLHGAMTDPYTGRRIVFDESDPGRVQIDHVVPLHAAWILGAWRWPPSRRLAFANDPRNLVAVDGPANQTKGDRLADAWRPPDPSVHCVYATDTVAVHEAYGLPVTRAERRTLQRMLTSCP